MIQIKKARLKDVLALTEVAKTSFEESHGHSASKLDISNYVLLNFNTKVFEQELENPKNLYYLIYYQNQLAGYSKIILNSPIPAISDKNICKLERIYLLSSFMGKGLGEHLFNFNMSLARENKQNGMWLFVWIENYKAITFYHKMEFKIVGSHDFKISETHSNPNHQMYLDIH